MEMVRVHNNECFDSSGDQIFDEIHTTTTTTTTTRYEEFMHKYGEGSSNGSSGSVDVAGGIGGGCGLLPAKVTTTESITYRRNLNGDLIEETTTTTTGACDGMVGGMGGGDDLGDLVCGGRAANNNTSGSSSNSNHSSSFVVKLYPSDEQEKEVQEMTMYVESPNATCYRQF